jgi:hypothetical protein
MAITNPSILIGARVISVPVPATHGVSALVGSEGSLDLETALLEQGLISDLATSVAARRKINIARRARDRCHARGGLTADPEGASSRAVLTVELRKASAGRARRSLQCGVVTVSAQSCNGSGETTRLLNGPKKAFGQSRGHLQAVSRVEREPSGACDGAAELGGRDPGGGLRVVTPEAFH